MAYTAYGIDYPMIELMSLTGSPPWDIRHSYTFGADNEVKLTPLIPIKISECPMIELENDSTKEFVRGWRIQWVLECKEMEGNTLTQFIYDYMLDWLRETTYDDYQILLTPHKDKSLNKYNVRVVGFEAHMTDNRFILGQTFKITFETIDAVDPFPYYEV